MKRTNTLVLLFTFIFACQVGIAQENRYLQEVFDDVVVTPDVTYGVNATILAITQVGELIPEELKMDIYEPANDNVAERPLVLVFHTGNFLPPVTNGQIAGSRTDSSAVEICTRLAKHGYVAASVTYRLGWNPLAPTQPERALGLIQAAYRGIQDGRTAIRYFKKTAAEDGNPYGVDTERITTFGLGTGGYLVLGLVGVTDYLEIPTTTNPPGKFLLDLNGDMIPETPMVVEAYHGDIEGKVLTVAPDDAFGFPAGDTSNYVNWPEYSSDFQLCTNVGGALGDISWLEEGDPPIISVQSAFDFFAPYDDAVLIVPTTGDPIVQVQGSFAVAQRQDELGNNQVFIDAGIDDVYTDQAIANSATAMHDYFEALYPVTNLPNGNGIDEGVIINWWDPGAPAPGAGMGIPWNMLPHPAGGTFHTQGLITNEGMSAEKARTNIDTILAYFAPRAFAALELDIVNTENLNPGEVHLQVAPNPVGNEVVLTTREENPMQSIRIFDINGRLVRSYDNINYHYFFMNRGDMPSGTYIVNIQFDQGQTSQKLIFD